MYSMCNTTADLCPVSDLPELPFERQPQDGLVKFMEELYEYSAESTKEHNAEFFSNPEHQPDPAFEHQFGSESESQSDSDWESHTPCPTKKHDVRPLLAPSSRLSVRNPQLGKSKNSLALEHLARTERRGDRYRWINEEELRFLLVLNR